ncbi:MAG: hypothetical protein JNM59_06100 [Hyphomonadaceae bacterium]|nr:hypothetical protein [Hyphomonadaceae bacterium]
MKRQVFTPFAKAQAFGLALGFVAALLAVNQLGYGIRLFLIATAAAWLAWEFLLGPRAPSHKSDARSLLYGGAMGFAFPWVGFLAAAAAEWLRP